MLALFDETFWGSLDCLFVCLFVLLILFGWKEGNVLFNDAFNTFYLLFTIKDHSNSERGNPLPPHRLFLPISSKGTFICIIPQTG